MARAETRRETPADPAYDGVESGGEGAKTEATLDSILDEVASPPIGAVDDLDYILGEIAALDAKAEDPLGDSLDEVAPMPAASFADDLDALLDEVIAPDVGGEDPLGDILDEIAPVPATSPVDDLDALLDEVAAPEVGGEDPLDSLLDEVAPQPSVSPLDDLASFLDEMVIPEDSVPAAYAMPAVAVSEADPITEPAEAVTRGRGGMSRRFAGKALLGLAGVVLLAGTNGLSYYLGTRSQPAHHESAAEASPPPAAKLAPPPVHGLDRYVGIASEARIDGKTIFETEEIKDAIQRLDGGDELQREVEKASRSFAGVVPIDRSGTLLRIYACAKLACDRDNVKIYYSIRARRAGVCRTKPYPNGARMSYAYSHFGMREVPNCDGNPFPKGI